MHPQRLLLDSIWPQGSSLFGRDGGVRRCAKCVDCGRVGGLVVCAPINGRRLGDRPAAGWSYLEIEEEGSPLGIHLDEK